MVILPSDKKTILNIRFYFICIVPTGWSTDAHIVNKLKGEFTVLDKDKSEYK